MNYTKEQAQDFLKDKKVYVNGKSKEIQEKLFECGITWANHIREVLYTNNPFLYIDEELKLTYGSDMDEFINGENIEITAEEILTINIIKKPNFKPFDKILVRNSNNLDWLPNHFASYCGNRYKLSYKTISGQVFEQCIPYEGNEDLAFTNKSPK